MSFKAALGFAVVGLVSWSLTPALAHHAHGNYQQTYVDMEGKVTEVHIILPHPWIYIEVVRDGQKQLWALEGGVEGIKVSKWATRSRCDAIR